MAPRKRKVKPQPANSTEMQSSARVAKSPLLMKSIVDTSEAMAKRRTERACQRVSLRNHNDSPLLRLPGEIRTTIYEYALGGKTWYINWARGVLPFGVIYREKDALALLRVCRQTHAEAAAIPFRLGTFVSCGTAVGFILWLGKVPSVACENVTSVRLSLDELCECRQSQFPSISFSSSIYRQTISLESLPSLKELHINLEIGCVCSSGCYASDKELEDLFEKVKTFHPKAKVTMKVESTPYGGFRAFK